MFHAFVTCRVIENPLVRAAVVSPRNECRGAGVSFSVGQPTRHGVALLRLVAGIQAYSAVVRVSSRHKDGVIRCGIGGIARYPFARSHVNTFCGSALADELCVESSDGR